MLDSIVSNAPVFLLVAVRCFTTIMFLPLLSSRGVSRIAKIALAGYMACCIFPRMSLSSGAYAPYALYINADGSFSLEFVFLLLGEGIIGAIIGFFVQIIFSAFSTAGQFFAFQMGFSASEVYDSLNQVENPLMGQFFNFVAMLIFLQNNWFQKVFLNGLFASFNNLNAFSIVNYGGNLALFMMKSLTFLFRDALIIALPIMGTLFIINVTMGILSKAAPQMNLLSEGFPILILTAFFIIALMIPYFSTFFEDCFGTGIKELQNLFLKLGGKIT